MCHVIHHRPIHRIEIHHQYNIIHLSANHRQPNHRNTMLILQHNSPPRYLMPRYLFLRYSPQQHCKANDCSTICCNATANQIFVLQFILKPLQSDPPQRNTTATHILRSAMQSSVDQPPRNSPILYSYIHLSARFFFFVTGWFVCCTQALSSEWKAELSSLLAGGGSA